MPPQAGGRVSEQDVGGRHDSAPLAAGVVSVQFTDFVCLANSRKAGGRCVAGIRLSGDWIRPVSGETDGRLYRHHYGLQKGSEPVPLDIIRLEAAPSPELHQPENWLVSDARWQRMGRLIFSDARDLLRRRATPGPGILGNQQSWVAYEDLAEHPGQAHCP
ncbi:MAG: dual OB domain-containing protein [Streptosporangiaceae bacterium]